MDSERSFEFLFPDPESVQHPPHIGCRPSATNPTVEPLGGVEHFAVNAEPYFVPSTASASEILTNVAIQDMLAADDPGIYELSCGPRSTSTLCSVPESSGLMFNFVYPLASSESSDSDSELVNESPRRSPEVSPNVSPDNLTRSTLADLSGWHEALRPRSFRPVHFNKTMRLITPSQVEIFFRNTYPDSPLGEDDEDAEEVIVVPVLPFTSSSFPHPHHLSTIPEEDEDEDGQSFSLNTTYEDEDEASIAETIRFTRIARPDTGLVWEFDGVEHLCESSPRVG